MAVRVAVQQQQRLFREGLGQLLDAEDDIEVSGTATTGEDLMRLCADQCPDTAVLEADATEWDVARLCAGLRRTHPGMRLIGVSAEPPSLADLSRARLAGMSALVSRVTGIAGIVAALRSTAATPRRGSVAVFKSPASTAPGRTVLTTRELHVLHLVGAGYTSREISGRLDISHKTVENHKQRIFGKLGVQNQAHAVSVAMRAGLLRADRVIDLAVGD